MRILHVGSGYRPLRRGGLVAYVEDLIAEQVRRGHEVHYLFSGRYHRYPSGLRMKRWRRHGAEMHEVVNSPLYDHGHQPGLEISAPQLDRLFARLLEDLRPDIVHVQELAGLPFSFLDVARESPAPVVMTLQDYFPVCSTFKLLDAENQVCARREIGADCAANLKADRRRPNLLYEGTARHLIYRTPIRRMALKHSEPLVHRILQSRLAALPEGAGRETAAPEEFQRRREVNVERLSRVDRLIAMSGRVAEIYSGFGVDASRLATMQLTLAHIGDLTPRRPSGSGPVTFATLGAGESVEKGSRLLLQAVRKLAAESPRGSFRLLMFGHIEPELFDVVAPLAEVELRGTYSARELNRLLDEVDVGIMPSIWEEAYGYAGIEFIAKGIPVIGNRIGGIPEYVREGETGWLNRSNSGQGLAEIMIRLTAEPALVEQVATTTRAARDELVVSLADHATELEGVYEEGFEVSRGSAASPG